MPKDNVPVVIFVSGVLLLLLPFKVSGIEPRVPCPTELYTPALVSVFNHTIRMLPKSQKDAEKHLMNKTRLHLLGRSDTF